MAKTRNRADSSQALSLGADAPAATIRGMGEHLSELEDAVRRFLATRQSVLLAALESLRACVRAGGKILVFGNGGSAAQSQHFVAELVNGMGRRDRDPLAAVALTADSSSITAIANDRAFDEVFSRQIEALGRRGDMAVALTTSGTSRDIVGGLKAARSSGLVTLALTGEGGGKVAPLADYLLDVPSCSTPLIQEAHLVILHFLAEALESGGA